METRCGLAFLRFRTQACGHSHLASVWENQSALVSKAPPTARVAQATRHPCGSPSKAIPARLRQRRLTPARHAQALLMPATPRKLITIRPDRVAPALYSAVVALRIAFFVPSQGSLRLLAITYNMRNLRLSGGARWPTWGHEIYGAAAFAHSAADQI